MAVRIILDSGFPTRIPNANMTEMRLSEGIEPVKLSIEKTMYSDTLVALWPSGQDSRWRFSAGWFGDRQPLRLEIVEEN